MLLQIYWKSFTVFYIHRHRKRLAIFFITLFFYFSFHFSVLFCCCCFSVFIFTSTIHLWRKNLIFMTSKSLFFPSILFPAFIIKKKSSFCELFLWYWTKKFMWNCSTLMWYFYNSKNLWWCWKFLLTKICQKIHHQIDSIFVIRRVYNIPFTLHHNIFGNYFLLEWNFLI